MSCCFMFYPFKSMDTSKSDVQSSVAEYLEKEKLCQEICETITKSVEGTELQGNCSLPMAAASLLPEFNSDDDVEEILQQISDLLGSQLGDNSQCTDVEGAEDLSVDEILKQAEEIVRASTPYFERKTYKNCSGVEPILEPIRRGVKQLGKRTIKSIPRHPPDLNESSLSHVNKNTRTDVSGSHLEVKNDVFDRNGNSPTPTNDTDDEVFESPGENSRAQTPLLKESHLLQKSCSDTNWNLKAPNDIRKSFSAGTCDIVNMCVENLQRLIEESGDHDKPGTHDRPETRVKELKLSDLNVSPNYSSKETISEAISPEEPNANGNTTVEEPLFVIKSTNLDPVNGGNGDHNGGQLISKVNTVTIVESSEQKPLENKEGSTTCETVRVEISDESERIEVTKNSGRHDQKLFNWNENNGQTLNVAKLHALQDVKRLKSPKKATIVNAKSSSKAVQEDGQNSCPNEDHCSIILVLRNQIESLSNKITEHEKFEARTRKNETLAAAERQRAKLLQEEVKSQEELIVGYQRENQRLSNDILSAKVGDTSAIFIQLVDSKQLKSTQGLHKYYRKSPRKVSSPGTGSPFILSCLFYILHPFVVISPHPITKTPALSARTPTNFLYCTKHFISKFVLPLIYSTDYT